MAEKVAKKNNDMNAVIVGSSVICDAFGLSPRRVRELAQEGIITKVKNGSYELIPTTKKYIEYLKLKSDSKDANGATENVLLEEKTKHERAKRKIAELELAQMQGRLHDAEDVEREMTKMISAFRARMLSIPSKMAAKLIAQTDLSIIENALSEEVYIALQEVSEYDPELFENDMYVGDVDEEIEEESN